VLQSLFGAQGLTLSACLFGECVRQSVIDDAGSADEAGTGGTGEKLSGGVVAGLAVVGALIGVAVGMMVFGWVRQRRARGMPVGDSGRSGGVGVEWGDVSYEVPGTGGNYFSRRKVNENKVVLDNVSGRVPPGQIMAVLGPSGEPAKF
jgi:ABC-type multidrug transport system fused ATPase/permease subunit